MVNRAFPGSEEHQLNRASYNAGPGKRLSLTSPGLTRSWPLPTLRKRLPGDDVWLPFWRGPVDRKQNHKGCFYPAMTVSSPTPVPEATALSTHQGWLGLSTRGHALTSLGGPGSLVFDCAVASCTWGPGACRTNFPLGLWSLVARCSADSDSAFHSTRGTWSPLQVPVHSRYPGCFGGAFQVGFLVHDSGGSP